MLESERRYQEARASYEAALRIDPSYGDARRNLANLLRNGGRR